MMSNRSRDDFDRLMTSWMEAEGRVREPAELLDRALDRTRATGRRPRWLVPEWWLSMQNTARLQAVWRPVPLLFILALLVVALALVAVLVGGAARRVPAPFGPAANGTLTYDTSATIAAANADGTGVRTLVSGVRNASAPTFSPDGQRFVFWGDGSPDSLYLADADGSNVRMLAGNLWIGTDKAPAWSPDSRRVAVATESGPDRFDEHLIVIDVGTGGGSALGPEVLDGLRALVPTWSPDGEWLAFEDVNVATDERAYWIVRPDGRDLRRLPTSRLAAASVAAHWAPAVAPLRIAYASAADDQGEPFVAELDVTTGVETRISTPETEPAILPAWSPSGAQLAWVGGSTYGQLFIASLANPARVDVLPASGIGTPIAWSPDGRQLYGLTPDRSSLVVVTVDGSAAPVRISHRASQGPPDWQRLAP